MSTTSQSIALEGFAYAAGTSQRQPARLLTRGVADSLSVEILSIEGNMIGNSNFLEVKVDPPLGSAPRKLTLPDGTIFETYDHDGVAQLTGRTRGVTLHQYEAFKPRLIGMVVACLAAIWLLWRYGLDIMVAIAVAFTPPVMIEQIDRGSLQTIDLVMADPSNLSVEQRTKIERIYRKLVASLPEAQQQKHSFDLLFRDMAGAGPNAFALPGGTMVITDAFAEMFPQPDVVAGVLSHEIGHVVEEHGLKRVYRSLSLYLLIAFLAGDTGPILEDIVLEGNLLLSLSFSRAQETSADEFGLTLANAAGFDPSGLKLFFETLTTEYGDDDAAQWMSTHPSNMERIQAIEEFIESL